MKRSSERTPRQKAGRSVTTLSVLAVLYLACRLCAPSGPSEPSDPWEARLDRALDSLVSVRFTPGAEITMRGMAHELPAGEDLRSEVERLELRTAVYGDTPDELMDDAQRIAALMARRKLDSLRTELADAETGPAGRVRRVEVLQSDGRRFTAFQKMDGDRRRSTLTAVSEIENEKTMSR